MTVSLKYAVVERERRFLVGGLPGGVQRSSLVEDRYLTGTRLRLRQVTEGDGSRVRKLTHKVRLGPGTREVACTNSYLDDTEWELLLPLPAHCLAKRRHHVRRDGLHLVVDALPDGTLLAEVDDGDGPPAAVPDWLDVLREVTDEEAWTGAALAARFAAGIPDR